MKLRSSLTTLAVVGLMATAPASQSADFSLNAGGGFLIDLSSRIHGEKGVFFNLNYNREETDYYLYNTTYGSEKAAYNAYGLGLNFNVPVVSKLDVFAGVGYGIASFTSENMRYEDTESGLTYQVGASFKLLDGFAINARYLNRPEFFDEGGAAISAGISLLY